MEKNSKDLLLEEHIRKIKYRTNYAINESPRYRPMVQSGEQFDEIPSLTNEAGENEPSKPNASPIGEPEGSTAPPSNAGSAPTAPQPAPEVPAASAEPQPAPMDNTMGTPDMMGAPMVEPQQQVDDIQNDIIKHNIAAMQSIHDKLEGLNSMVQNLNSKLEVLNTDVEEVKEPTNTEKLMSKKNVSYPYYFNLNDFWSGNWFDEKRAEQNEKGIRQLPDGTYVADFDDLPTMSKTDIQKSFNEII